MQIRANLLASGYVIAVLVLGTGCGPQSTSTPLPSGDVAHDAGAPARVEMRPRSDLRYQGWTVAEWADTLRSRTGFSAGEECPLGYDGEDAAIPMLVELLQEEDQIVRFQAVLRLGFLRENRLSCKSCRILS